MTASAEIVPERPANPYVGPRPFEAEDEDKFFGRDEEARELLAIITATPITLLYAQSGAGKTSLIKAKLIPLLLRRPCEVYGPLRVASPEESRQKVKNVYTFNALCSAAGASARPTKFANMTLTEYLASLPKPEPRGGIRRPRVVIFDQFEDTFTRYSERWQDRSAFFEDVKEALATDPRLRIVFAMREEYLAEFEAYSADVPPTGMARFRLERLRREAAREAIERPVVNTPVRYKPKAVEKLLNNLMSLPKAARTQAKYEEFAEAVQLQIVCFNLWESLSERLGTGEIEIVTDDIKSYGNVDEALRSYYARCVDEIVHALGEKHRFQAGKLRTWIERTFINDEGKRSMVYKGATATAGFPNEVVDALERKYLVRAEPRGLTTWIELSHERFIRPILESNREWRSRADVGNRAGSLERRASQWAKAGRPETLLLPAQEVRRTRNWLQEEGANIGVTPLAEEYVRLSGELQQTRSTQRMRMYALLSVFAVMVVVAILLQTMSSRSRERDAFARAYDDVARSMIAQRRPLDALAISIRAVTALPADERTGSPPAETLRRALEITSSSTTLQRPGITFPRYPFSPDGRRLLTQSSQEICIWDLERGGTPKCRSATDKGEWRDARFSRDGSFVVARMLNDDSGPSGRPVVWRGDGSNLLHIPDLHDSRVDGCGRTKLVIVTRERLSVFDVETGEKRSVAHNQPNQEVFVTPDCRSIAARSSQGITFWSPALTAKTIPVAELLPGNPPLAQSMFRWRAATDQSGEYIVMQFPESDAEHAVVLNSIAGTVIGHWPFVPPAEQVLQVGPSTVAVQKIGEQTHLRYHDAATGRVVAEIPNVFPKPGFVHYQSTTATGVADGVGDTSVVDTIDLRTRTHSRTTIGDRDFDVVMPSRDGRWLLTRKDEAVRLWDLRAGSVDVRRLSVPAMLTRACAQLARFGDDAPVRTACEPFRPRK